ncbi:hypothetical protein [[Clostridium] polysaccharolyticum]|uniref:Uncharacterized protein n=1 Tax=[Clostridium] polysaccharolyticum TaxID=29364 RepID=A0A1H9Y8S5_9FIRM|nr:hypothetical protein [[Clostridium] polysaccharolyticum]SES65335.1 hypothetical protein SAMN04487772_101222 [[Clostridium] polysaccharolyticum]
MEVVKMRQILKKNDGSTVIDVAVWVLVMLIIFSVAFEYIRVQIICYNLKDTFENEIQTVLSENYDEVYAGFRESRAVGGQFEGGPEGAAEDNEEPEWIDLNDSGDVEQEIEDLLAMDSLEDPNGSFEIRDIKVKVRNGSDTDTGKYEVNGSMKVLVPIKIVGITVKTSVPVKTKIVYNEMY